MTTWTIGDVTVTPVLELEIEGELDGFIPQATPENLAQSPWLVPDHVTPEGSLRMRVQAFAVQAPGLRLVIDTCAGDGRERKATPLFHQLSTAFLSRLEATGFAPETVDRVICTHLHPDHVGWNTRREDDRWVPTFPNARYLIGREEYEESVRLAGALAGQPIGDLYAAVFGDAIQPVVEAGLVDLVETDHRICDEISLTPTPGHTLGHVSVVIRSRGEAAIVTGDAVHHPCQLEHLDWSTVADADGREAARTRRAMFEQACAEPRALVIGSHWAGAGAGRLVRHGEGFRLG